MSQYLWVIYGLAASIMWGIGYALDEYVLKAGIKPVLVIFVNAAIVLPVYAVLAFNFLNYSDQFIILKENRKVLVALLIGAATIVLGNFFIYQAIAIKNASIVTLLEISYPIFVIFFTWVFFKQFHMTPWTILGGITIFIGVGIIILKG